MRSRDRCRRIPIHCCANELELIVGELHHQLKPKPSPAPRWLSIPERGLYTGICVVGAIGSGKTKAVILPAMRQLFAYRAGDPAQRLSGVVLEVKGDLCRQVQRILEGCGRGQDYVDVSLDGDIRYNPLNNDADAYAQAFNIASVIVAIWGKGKEPFWQQSYTDLVRYVIMLHRVRDGYVTMLDIFRTVISSGTLERMLIEVGHAATRRSHLSEWRRADYLKYESTLAPFRFAWSEKLSQYIARWTEELETVLVRQTGIAASLYSRKPAIPRYAAVGRASTTGTGSIGSSFAPRPRPRLSRALPSFSRCSRPMPRFARSSARRRNCTRANPRRQTRMQGYCRRSTN